MDREIYLKCNECENLMPEKFYEDHSGKCLECIKEERNSYARGEE